MKTTDTFDFPTPYGATWHCRFAVSRYVSNGNLALTIKDAEDGEPLYTVTVNVGKLSDEMIAVKNYSENKGMDGFLKSIGIIRPKAVRMIRSGWVEIPVYELTDSGKELFSGV